MSYHPLGIAVPINRSESAPATMTHQQFFSPSTRKRDSLSALGNRKASSSSLGTLISDDSFISRFVFDGYDPIVDIRSIIGSLMVENDEYDVHTFSELVGVVSRNLEMLMDQSDAPMCESFDCMGNVTAEQVVLLSSTGYSLSACIMPAGARTPLIRNNSGNEFVIPIVGETWLKSVFIVPCEDPTKRLVETDILDATLGKYAEPRIVSNVRFKVSTKNLLEPLRVAEIKQGSCHSLKAGKKSVLLRLCFTPAEGEGGHVAGSGDGARALIPASTLIWEETPAEIFAGQSMINIAGLTGVPRPTVRHVVDSEQRKAFVRSLRDAVIRQRYSTSVALQTVTSRSLVPVYKTSFLQLFKFHCRELNNVIAQRPDGTLQSQDAEPLIAIGDLLSLYVYHGGSVEDLQLKGTRALAVQNDGVDVMRRIMIYNDTHLNLRFHLFNDASETFVHNHKSNFVSMNLFGQYVHKSWIVDNTSEGYKGSKYCQRMRHDNGHLMEETTELDGHLVVASTFLHTKGNAYFLHHDTLHSVFVPPDAGSVLTLLAKTNQSVGPGKPPSVTRVVYNAGEVDSRIPDVASETPLDAVETGRMLHTLDRLLLDNIERIIVKEPSILL